MTGFVAMAMEVVWTRAFTPVLSTEVYSFAFIVFTYLAATSIGSWLYRRGLRNGNILSSAEIVSLLPAAAGIPVLINDPRLLTSCWQTSEPDLRSCVVLLASICPFCALLGYLTPGLVDKYSAGRPSDAGRAYAINVVGCIIGPLLASYVLLPHMSEKWALLLLSAPLFGFYLLSGKTLSSRWRLASGLAAGAVIIWGLFLSEDFEEMLVRTQKHTEIRRDYAASVISFGEGFDRRLLVNGMGMTILTPITKFMVHLPMAMHRGKPQSVLVICFGMGTSFRSAMSWGADTTAVELVPGVPETFGFYHADAAQVRRQPNGRIIIDDGRRFLSRTREKFDVIVVDPPPPSSAAGSSLLYSQEFYALAKQHLKPNGIFQVWYPGGGKDVLAAKAVVAAFYNSFPHMRWFGSIEGWGTYLLGSMEPIENLSPAQLAGRMPDSAKCDLLEWTPARNTPAYLAANSAAYVGRVMKLEFEPTSFINPAVQLPLTDDLPYNEYFLLRHLSR